MDLLRALFGSGNYEPHGYCYLWNPGLVWLHVISDSLIAISYFAIPAVLLWFVRKRRDLPFNWIFILFGVFIIACGTTHVMEVWNLWHADYWLAGLIKSVTALASVSTAILLVNLTPKALALPGLDEMMTSTLALETRLREKDVEEKASLVREAEYRDQAALLDLTHDAIFVRNMRGEITYWNRSAEQLYGWRKHEAMGRLSHDLLHTIFPSPVEEIEAQVRETGAWEGELIHTKKDGSAAVVSSRWALQRDAQGVATAFLESNRDVTLRRLAEDEVRKLNNELKDRVASLNQLNRELEAFSYSVSHDLRAPLRHIVGFAEILKEEFRQQVPQEAMRYMTLIIQAASQMGNLIDDLLAFAHLGRKEVARKTVNLDELAGQAIDEMRGDVDGRVIRWVLEPLGETDCDPGLVKLVFSNLISNAVKFSGTRQMAVITIGKRENNQETSYFVRDNGVGFDPQYADKLFGVFQRLHRHEDFNGTGIGLATVRRIIERHHGSVWAESKMGEGASFYFTLSGGQYSRESGQLVGTKNDGAEKHD